MLVLQLVEDEPALIESVEEQARLVLAAALDATPTVPSPAATPTLAQPAPLAPPSPPVVNVSALRREARLRLAQVQSGRGARRGHTNVGDVTSELAEAVEQAQQLLAAGDGRAALAVLDMLTEEFFQVWDELDDSDGASSLFFEDLGTLWAEALLTAELTPQERQTRTQKFEPWLEELSDYGLDGHFDAALVAARRGWDDPRIHRALRGEAEAPDEDGADANASVPTWSEELLDAYLNVLERQGCHEEYLNLARAADQRRRYAIMLAQLGRGEEALASARAHLTTATAAHDLALALWDRGDTARAVESAELGLTLDGPKAALASWLRDRAVELGQTERALAAAEIAFRDALSLDTYLKVQELAGPAWDDLRPRLLDRLRTRRSYYPQGPVEIFLHEGLIDDAIAAVDGGATHRLVELVADAASATHPDWVIKASRKQAESIMDEGKSQYYGSAARWLARARDAYLESGREAEWRAYLASLLERHRRKYSLVPLLKAL
ncbi:MAG: hypothetical protein IT306_20675 [Chloroflexi bacterium]|nr:hypothetical protein [Chloroflexota bacterium]